MELPDHLKQSLSETDLAKVTRWWNSLSADQRRELLDVSDMDSQQVAELTDLDDFEPEPETQPFYDYLINHELRLVGYVDEETVTSSYRIATAYIASLGSDYRHGRGTVR